MKTKRTIAPAFRLEADELITKKSPKVRPTVGSKFIGPAPMYSGAELAKRWINWAKRIGQWQPE